MNQIRSTKKTGQDSITCFNKRVPTFILAPEFVQIGGKGFALETY